MLNLTQPQRLGVAVIELAILLVISRVGFGQILPEYGARGLWFYTALLSIIVAGRLVTPFWERPADAVAYATTAILALVLIPKPEAAAQADLLLVIVFAILILAVLFALFAIATSRSESSTWQRLSQVSTLLTRDFGSPRLVFSLVLLYAAVSFHGNSAREVITIALAWALTVAFRPVEGVYQLIGKLRGLFAGGEKVSVLGEVVAYQTPGMVIVRQTSKGNIAPGSDLVVKDPHEGVKWLAALDNVGRDQNILTRTIELSCKSTNIWVEKVIARIPSNLVLKVDSHGIEPASQQSAAVLGGDRLVGIVATGSSIGTLFVEAISANGLEEGRLIKASIYDQPVIYQVVDGITEEEFVHKKNAFGFVRVKAKKIGYWDQEESRFKSVNWVPNLNTPVFLLDSEGGEPSVDAVGVFPSTSFELRIKSLHELVTHNAAILGILGIGKSTLCFELVERLIHEGIKVICLDLTDEYSEELKEYCYDLESDALYSKVVGETGPKGKQTVSKHVEEGGSKQGFAEALDEYIESFVRGDCGKNLVVFNPAQYEVWRQDAKPYNEEASMASLTPTEIAQLFTEASLKVCQKLGKVEPGEARVCLIYEEAHSLVPEWGTVVNEGDKAAVNGTARAILQGRKFGLGCILITQRTANVTKTILNQCNTIFAMRTFDDTGMGFLSNYIGSDYAESLPNIREWQAVVFGKASSCENPVLVQLNERSAFTTTFRRKHAVGSEKVAKFVDESAVIPPKNSDDVPF